MSARDKSAARRGAKVRTPSRAPAAKRAASPKPAVERRQARRLDVLWQLNVEIVSRPMPVSVSDISTIGFSVETTTPFRDSEVHVFKLSLDEGPSVIVDAESAHSVPTDRIGELQLYLTGFKFVNVDTPTKQALKMLFAEIQEHLALT